jgi:hypothetical protein
MSTPFDPLAFTSVVSADKRRLQLPVLKSTNESKEQRRLSAITSTSRRTNSVMSLKAALDTGLTTQQLQKRLADVAQLLKEDYSHSPPTSARKGAKDVDDDEDEEEIISKPLKSPVKEKKKENRWLIPSALNKSSHESVNLTINSLFELLWERDPTTNASAYGILFPDTISFHRETNSNPQWYFTSIKDSKMYKKNSYNVTTENIYQALLKKRRKKNKRYMMPASNSEPDCKDLDVVAFAVFEVGSAGNKRYVRTEFLNEKGLRKLNSDPANFQDDLLFNGKTKEQECFIQRFIPPRGEHDRKQTWILMLNI